VVALPLKLLNGSRNSVRQVSASCVQWYTVGSRLPAQAAYAAASYQETPATG
jgi:hypothetical protein